MSRFTIPEQAIRAFERFTGLRVTIHDFERSLAPHLEPDRYAHYFGLCQKVKSSSYNPFCCRFEVDRLRRQIGSLQAGRWHICHAGLVEWVIPVVDGQKLVWILFAGTRTPAPGLTRGYRDRDSLIHAAVWRNDALRPPPVDDAEAELLLEMLHLLAARLRNWRAEFQSAGFNRLSPQREYAIRSFVYRRCNQPLRLADLADHLHLSRSRTAHVVKECCGAGFVELLTAARLRRACELLRHTDDPVAVIADRCGFGDVSHFHRVFRRRIGITPRQYRLRGD